MNLRRIEILFEQLGQFILRRAAQGFRTEDPAVTRDRDRQREAQIGPLPVNGDLAGALAGVSEAFALALLDEGLVVAPGAYFGPAGEGYVRIALVPTLQECERAAERLLSWRAAPR